MNNHKSRVNLINAKDLHKPIPNLKNPEPPFREKPHVSTWFITLNSNIRADKDLTSTTIGNNLIGVLENVFKDQDKLLQFLEFNNRELGGDDYKLTKEMINNRELFPDIPDQPNSNFQLKYIQETGPLKKREHLHAEFQVVHYTMLRMNYERLQELVSQELKNINAPFDSVYMNLKFVKSALPLVNYMLKSEDKYDKSLKKIQKQRFIESSESEYDETLSMLKDFQIN